MADQTSNSNIVEPHPHDVLSGRGNSANRHPGNAHFRDLVKSNRNDYVSCPKPSKPIYAKLIYNEIQSMNPPGRFLKQDPVSKKWNDIGKKAALAKIRQALREGAPEIIRDMQTMEQFSRCSQAEVAQALGIASSVQNAPNQANNNTNGISNYPPVPNVPGSFSGIASNHNAPTSSTAGQCVTESSASSLSEDSVSFSQTRASSSPGRIQSTQQIDTLLRLQMAFQQANQANQVGQSFTGSLNDANTFQQAHQSFHNHPISASMPNLQQQLNNALENSESEQSSLLLALLLNSIGAGSNQI